MIASLWNMTDISAAVLPKCLSNFRAIGQVQSYYKSRGFETLWDFSITRRMGYWKRALRSLSAKMFNLLSKLIWVATGYIDKLTNTHERSFSHSWSCVAYSVPIHSLIAIGVKAWMSNYLPDKYLGRTLKMHVSNECSLMRHLSTHIVLFVEREWEWGWEWEWERFWAALYLHSTPT